MPRARNIKPSFFKDAKVVSCSFPARLLFEGMWCIADYKGRFKYVPLEIKMEIFPADDVDIGKLTDELVSVGLIEKYTDHSGSTLVQVLGFEKHQNPHQNERMNKDRTPAPCLPSKEDCKTLEGNENKKKTVTKQCVEGYLVALREWNESNPADSLFLIPDSLKLIPDSLEVKKPKKQKPKIELDYSNWPSMPSDELLKEWLDHRKNKKLSISQTVIKTTGKELAEIVKKGWTVEEALEEFITRGWQGIKSEYYKDKLISHLNNSGYSEVTLHNIEQGQRFLND